MIAEKSNLKPVEDSSNPVEGVNYELVRQDNKDFLLTSDGELQEVEITDMREESPDPSSPDEFVNLPDCPKCLSESCVISFEMHGNGFKETFHGCIVCKQVIKNNGLR